MTARGDLLQRSRGGDVAATAQLISAFEGRAKGSETLLPELYSLGGNAHVVGVTGAPGTGKSTLVAGLARVLRRRDKTVAIVAVDPSSSLSGGAILGDRIRMQEHTLDPGVFVRSMSTRGSLGGLSRATVDAVAVLDAAGFDVVIVETVGVGQAEVEIVQIAHTTIVVSVPGLGDDVQAIKAGLLEIADLYVVNKSDRPDADRTMAELLGMLALATRAGDDGWPRPVLAATALDGTGLPELADAVGEHMAWLRRSGDLRRRERSTAAARIRSIAKELLVERIQDPARGPAFDRVVDEVAARTLDPHSAARRLIGLAAAEAPVEAGVDTSGGESTDLIDETVRRRLDADLRAWEGNELAGFLERRPESQDEYYTGSRRPVKRVYTPADVADIAWEEIGLPGRFPFTRGPYPTMYRGRPWTMRQIAGFGTPDETNARFKYLIAQGQTGLSVDFDMPTLMGYDSDDPKSEGEVGREGVAVDVLEDMDRLFAGIDLEEISVSMTINPSAWILLAMFVAVAEQRGLDLNRLSGTIQNDILKEYIAQKEWIYPPEPSMRIVRDTITYAARHMTRYNPINISGYHISEAGSSPLQEAAFTMATTRAYVQSVTAAGVDVDTFAPRLSFFFVAQADFFEEIAKFRALRRFYARMMRDEFGARNPDSMRLRFHTQTAAATLTKPQPLNNIVRTTIQALSAVLGGTQSLHTNGLDEAYAIPSELAMKVALRTQQILAEETNVTQVIDPLGGAYYVEALTREFENGMHEYLTKIDALGGTLRAIELNFFQREIADFAYDFAQRKARGARTVVGVNKFIDASDDQSVTPHTIDPTSEGRKIQRLGESKRTRDNDAVARTLDRLLEAARDPDANLMPPTIDAVKAGASMGEIVNKLEGLFGRYRETPVF